MPSAFFSPTLFHRYSPYSGSYREVVAVVVHRDVFHQVVEVVACALPRTPLATGGEANPLA